MTIVYAQLFMISLSQLLVLWMVVSKTPRPVMLVIASLHTSREVGIITCHMNEKAPTNLSVYPSSLWCPMCLSGFALLNIRYPRVHLGLPYLISWDTFSLIEAWATSYTPLEYFLITNLRYFEAPLNP
jgi:hypothetical protein